MTWLFTQVWLWSLAAFVLGSLLTWLLFVWPLQRRLDAARSQLDELGTVLVEPRGSGFGDELPVVREEEHSAWDLLRGEHDERAAWAAGPDPSPAGSPEWPPSSDSFGGVADTTAPDEGTGVPVEAADPGLAEAPEVRGSARTPESESEQDPKPQPENPNLSGRLQSLFDSLESPGIEPDRQESPYVPPVGAEEAASAGNERTASGSERADAPDGEQPLPRRIPGATSKPGTPPQRGVAAPKFRAKRSEQSPATSEEGEAEAAPSAKQPESGPEAGSSGSSS